MILAFKFPESLEINNSFVPTSRPSVMSLSDVSLAMRFSFCVKSEIRIVPYTPTAINKPKFSE